MYESKRNILKAGDIVSVSFDGFDVPCFVNNVRYGQGSRLQLNVSAVSAVENQSRWVPLERVIYPLLDNEGCLIGFDIVNPAVKVG